MFKYVEQKSFFFFLWQSGLTSFPSTKTKPSSLPQPSIIPTHVCHFSPLSKNTMEKVVVVVVGERLQKIAQELPEQREQTWTG